MQTPQSRITIGLIPLVVLAVSFAVATAADDARLAQKHSDYLKSHLNDPDELACAESLGGLARYNLRSQIERLKATLKSENITLRHVGLQYLRGQATRDDLQVTKAIVEAASIQANAEDGADDAVSEVLGLDILLSSDDADMRSFATERMRQVLLSKDAPLFRWHAIVDLASDHQLRDFIPRVRESCHDEIRALMAVVPLVKMGDQRSIERLQKSARLRDMERPLLCSLAGDPIAMRAAKIDAKTLLTIAESVSFRTSAERQVLFASLGASDALRQSLEILSRGRRIPDDPGGNDTTSLLAAAANYGSIELAKVSDAFFDRSKDVNIRIACSCAVLAIVKRAEEAKR